MAHKDAPEESQRGLGSEVQTAHMDDSALAQLAACLESTQVADRNVRKQAEAYLESLEQQPGFSMLLLKLAQQHTSPTVSLTAAISFKNLVKKRWQIKEDHPDVIGDENRHAIKAFIVDLMLSSPIPVQRQLSEALSIIADNDFPQNWDYLLQNLVLKIDPSNLMTTNGILQTAHAIFKRYRHTFRSDALFKELLFVLQQFAAPLLELMKATDKLIETNAENRDVIFLLYENLFLEAKIFYSLNAQDIPEFFEDHIVEFMAIFQKYLTFSSQTLKNESGGDPEKVGAFERVRTAIIQNTELYAQKYEEEFTMLPEFVQTVWTLLVTTGLEPKNDMLVSEAIRFLSTVAKNKRHQSLFSEMSTLNSICEKVIIPNLQFREVDEELFEDNPMEYIRRDLEGSDFDTRRRAACDFVRSLTELFPAEVTQIFSGYISIMLQQFQAEPTRHWKAKDTAIVLVIALAVKTSTASLGATNTNSLVNLGEFFSSHVLPNLQTAVDGPLPVLKTDAIKYIHTFRNQIPKEALSVVFPLLVTHLTSGNVVVASYAAIAIERLMALKRENHFVFAPEELSGFLQALLQNLFSLIMRSAETPSKLAENDHAMRAIMRAVMTFKELLKPIVSVVIKSLTKILVAIAKEPSNPKFNHNLFEALGALVKFAADPAPESVAMFESLLFPPFQDILRDDITEFTPYVFQILSQLLELRSGPESIAGAYVSLLPPLLSSYLWEQQGNITPLVRLLRAYLFKGAQIIVSQNLLEPILGVFQKLIASRTNDHEGFYLVNAIFQTVPIGVLNTYIQSLFSLLLQRLMNSRTAKFVKGFVVSFFFFAVTVQNGPSTLYQTLNTIQPGLFRNLYEAVLLAEVQKTSGMIERKICVVGLVKIATEATALQAELPALVASSVVSAVKLIELPEEEDANYDDDADFVDIEGYQSVYSRLASAQKLEDDPLVSIRDPRAFLVQSLTVFANSNPGKLKLLLQGVPADVTKVLGDYMSKASIDINALLR